MPQSYEELLIHYAETRDAEAFRQIVMRYRNMVYAACKRVLRNGADAEDATQNCFLVLSRQPGKVNGSLAGWLHRTATCKSVDLIRQDNARRAREAETMKNGLSDESAAWEGISHALDQAINDLPDELRIPIIRCYLEGHRQEDAAREMRVSQSAVAKRLQRGIETLRAALRKGGWMGSVTLLATLLASKTSEAAPAALTASLGKLAIAGTTGASTGAAAGGTGIIGGLGAMKLGIAGLSAAVIVGIAITVVATRNTPDASSPPPSASTLTTSEPIETALLPTPTDPTPVSDETQEIENAKGDSVEDFIQKAVDAVFKAEDPQALLPYFDPDAERKNDGRGSAISSLKQQPRNILNRIVIKETIFFSAGDVPDLAAKLPGHMWDADRLPARLGDAVGACLIVISTPQQGTGQPDRLWGWACVVRKINDEYKIVYIDDN